MRGDRTGRRLVIVVRGRLRLVVMPVRRRLHEIRDRYRVAVTVGPAVVLLTVRFGNLVMMFQRQV